MTKSDNTEPSTTSSQPPVAPPVAPQLLVIPGSGTPESDYPVPAGIKAESPTAEAQPANGSPVAIISTEELPASDGSELLRAEATADRPGEINQTIDLKKLYPITFRRAFKKAFWRGAVCAIFGGIYYASDTYLVPMLSSPEEILTARAVVGTLFALSFVWWLARLVYYQLERHFIEYRVEGGNLFLRRGMFVKETGSFPLSRITDIYLHRGWGDFFWGLSSLHVSTPTQSSGTFAYIHGLTIRNAETLQRHLQELVKEHDYQLQLITGHVGTLAASASRRQHAEEDAAR